jgi:(E)-2-((N-methylformamido)methylene)succinate hydrolase
VNANELILCDGTCASVSGTGPALVFLHGVGLSQTIWAEQVKAFAPTYRVIAYDLLGHGSSAAVSENATLEDWVLQLENLTRDLSLDRFSLVGFSFGGMIAQAYAAKHADRIDRLVLMNTVYDRSGPERANVIGRLEKAQREGPQAIIAAALSRWFSPEFSAARSDLMQYYEAMLTKNNAVSFLAAYRCFATSDQDLVGRLSSFDHHTLVMTGALDGGSTADMAGRLAATIPGAQCSILPQARHMMPVEMPDEVNSVLRRFLNGEGP